MKFDFILLKLGYRSKNFDFSPVSRKDIETSFTISEDLHVKFLIQGESRKVMDAVAGRTRVESRL